jgi:hypothetical protein
MAEPFQPKFVDLVRNSTATTGTGNFTLGQPLIGFTTFASALSPGDRFYYCAVNVDKPAEREVGRGTLMADGTIAREAVQGALVAFTGGTKMVALVTPAEWFNAMQSGGGSGAPIVATRSALAELASAAGACTLREAGREGLFVFDPANRAAEVAADSAEGLFVPPIGQTGSSGAWVRKFSGPVNVKWFGATGDGTTNDGAAFVAAIAALKAIAGNVSANGFYKASPKLFVPAGHYFLGTTTLDITHTLVIEGEGVGHYSAGASKLRWAANTTGIRIQRYNTSGVSTVDGTTHFAGDGTVLRSLSLVGSAGAEGEHHAVHTKAIVTIEDCLIDSWQGDGIHATTSVGGGASEGNSNFSRVSRVRIDSVRDGISISGSDANVWLGQAVDITGARRWGINDNGFLGSSWLSCHTANIGLIPGAIPTVVSHSGNRYAVRDGQNAAASTTAPSGTAADNSSWYYIGAGGVDSAAGIPSWASGMTVRAGGGYRTGNSNAESVFTGCYSEGGQGPSQFASATLVIGGKHDAGVKGVARLATLEGYFGSTAGLLARGDLRVEGAFSRFGPQSGTAADNQFFFDNTNFYNFLTFRSWNGGTPQTDAEFLSARGTGFILKGFPGIQLRHGPTNTTILDMTSGGIAVTGTVSASGPVSGANLSGTNTGDQLITLTGDVTGSGGGSFAATIANNAVSYAKLQDVGGASRLLGRGSAGGAGDAQEITLGSGLAMFGTTLSVSGTWAETTLGADVTGTTSFSDISDGTNAFSYTPPANSNFEMEALLLIETSTATNLPQIGVHVNAQGTGAYGVVQIDQTGATVTSRVIQDGTFTTSAVDIQVPAGGLAAANTPYLCFVTVRGRTGVSPAAISLQLKSETTPANNCKVRQGSQLRTKAS